MHVALVDALSCLQGYGSVIAFPLATTQLEGLLAAGMKYVSNGTSQLPVTARAQDQGGNDVTSGACIHSVCRTSLACLSRKYCDRHHHLVSLSLHNVMILVIDTSTPDAYECPHIDFSGINSQSQWDSQLVFMLLYENLVHLDSYRPS